MRMDYGICLMLVHPYLVQVYYIQMQRCENCNIVGCVLEAESNFGDQDFHVNSIDLNF